jgi:hypothetical protein
VVIESDLAPAAWIEPLLRARSFEVAMTVPQGFESYARIFFPFAGEDIETDGVVTGEEHVTWTETARRNQRVAHALMEQETILAPGQQETCLSELADEQFEALLGVLSRHTSSAHSWFLLWHGFGILDERVFQHEPTVKHPAREFYLLSGALSAYRGFPHDPNYWWPDDQAWCLCTDTDFNWAYIAGSAEPCPECPEETETSCPFGRAGLRRSTGTRRRRRSAHRHSAGHSGARIIRISSLVSSGASRSLPGQRPVTRQPSLE